ncbi:MAG TPA: hypothetical protein HA362_08125 [Nanoarchaeota archaeon]|nr:hypothetical protein [Nanoarchaeota archaeon]
MKKEYIILFAIFILTFAFRAFFALQTDNFSADSAYYNLRHTDYISQNLQPMIYDDLSYGGRYIIDAHIFHYMLAAARVALPDFFVFKLLPEMLFAAMIFIVYAIAKRLTQNTTAPLLAALISGFIPIFIQNSVNSISVYSIVFPLIFYQVYCLMNIETHKGRFVALSIMLPIIHPFTAVLVISFIFYAILLNVESIKIRKQAREAIIFFALLVLLMSFIIYKKAFLSLGLYAVLQNIPPALLNTYFVNINVFSLISGIGIIPLILGAMGIVFGLSWEKSDSAYLLSALVLSDFVLLFLKLISFAVGMMFLGILLSILSAVAIEKAVAYVKITKFARFKKPIFAGFIVLVALLLVLPSYLSARTTIRQAVSADEINALEWIKANSPGDSTVLGYIEDGDLIAAVAKRKTVADTTFMFAPDRYDDVHTMLTTESLVKATQLMHRYGVDYIFISQKVRDAYKMEDLKNANTECFEAGYSGEKAKVYKLLC